MDELELNRARRRKMIERWAYYLIGVSIGFLILGIYWAGRQRAVQRTGGTAQTQQAPAGE